MEQDAGLVWENLAFVAEMHSNLIMQLGISFVFRAHVSFSSLRFNGIVPLSCRDKVDR